MVNGALTFEAQDSINSPLTMGQFAMQSLAYPQEHLRDTIGWLAGRVRYRPNVGVDAESEVRSKERVFGWRVYYAGLLAAGIWNMFAAGSPLDSPIGIATFIVNICVGASFLWILIQPPYVYVPDRPEEKR
jgi:hypothetical protein